MEPRGVTSASSPIDLKMGGMGALIAPASSPHRPRDEGLRALGTRCWQLSTHHTSMACSRSLLCAPLLLISPVFN